MGCLLRVSWTKQSDRALNCRIGLLVLGISTHYLHYKVKYPKLGGILLGQQLARALQYPGIQHPSGL